MTLALFVFLPYTTTMKIEELALVLRVEFEDKITNHYYDSFRGEFGSVQMEVLQCLFDCPELRANAISSKLQIPKQHSSKILHRLEDEDLVSHEKDKSDGRADLYSLTKKGSALMEAHLEMSNSHFLDSYHNLSKEDQKAMAEAMETLYQILKKFPSSRK